jgi:hypothetical protein
VPAEPLSTASSVVIEETTGAGRSITLRGRALPYQGVGFGGKMRTAVTWYPGNPEATIQVLGPELDSTTMEGMWKDRFLLRQAELSGFDAALTGATAAQLVRAFEILRDSGNELRVQWADTVRRGILTEFVPTWLRSQDVRWTATWTWFAANPDQPVRAAPAPLPGKDVNTALIRHDNAFVSAPKIIAKDYLSEINGFVDGVRRQAGKVFDAIREAQRQIQTPVALVQKVLSAADSLQAEAEDEVGRLTNIPYTYAQTADRVVGVLSVEAWRRRTAGASDRLVAAVKRTAEQYERTIVSDVLDVIVVSEDVTLRQLSTRYYGSPDSWTVIADANGLVDSVVPAGTVLVIPSLPNPAATRPGR